MNICELVGRIKLTAAALLLSVAFSATAFADTGGLQLKVTDADGNPVAGASVHASTSDSLTTKSGTTDASGGLRLMGLDPSDAYVISVTADGFQPQRNENVLVVSERTYDLPFALTSAAGQDMEEIITYGRTDIGQLVDTTSALQSTDVTLDIMDSLPTGRSYQSYLQMAPTTKPTNVESGGNPSSKSGVNYSDIGGTNGSSSDNVYYIDGVNVTDNLTGTFGANFNSEIIQEQQIITGGVPAEYEGGQGLISRVVTKSGSNEFHGSFNYYTQSDGLVANNDNLADASYDTFDSAFTLGGPIVKDKLWFFTSFQKKEREEDVIDPVTQAVLRSVTSSSDFGFAKLTWQATDNDKVVAEFFNDPLDRDGSFTTTILPNRNVGRDQGGDNLKFEYSHAWENMILTASYTDHEGELTSTATDKSIRNDVAFLNIPVTNAETDLGGRGFDRVSFRDREELKLEMEFFVDSGMGSHDIKAGYSQIENTFFEDEVWHGDGSFYTSIGNPVSDMITLDSYVNDSWLGEVDIEDSDFDDIQRAMVASPDSAYFLGLLDTDMSGVIDVAELGALVMDQTTGNPTGDINAYRVTQAIQGPQNFRQEADVFYIQDSWSIDDHWTVDIGFRAEEWAHFASDSSTKVFTFDREIAPRLSVVYDLKGDGASKVWGFFGRYYDPIRTNMTSFAGSITGSVLDEQAYIGNQWLTFRTRGGPAVPDAFFAPTTKTPYTDEFMLGWEHSLTADQSISITYTDRITEDILEDYELGLYTDPARCGTLCLGLEYFGFETAPEANFFIATLAGGKREYQGLEVTWRKRRSADSKWFGLASWSYNDAQGNTNSDSNADFQGDVIWLDPRAPNQFGDQPGSIEHLLKFAGSYRWDNGIEVGATYAWNSGTLYSDTWAVAGRHLPIRVDTAYDFGGVTTRWLDDGVIGGSTSDSYGTMNARAKYVMEFGESYSLEFFLDIFNVFDDQAERTAQDLLAGDGVFENGESVAWVLPRRFYLGARMSF